MSDALVGRLLVDIGIVALVATAAGSVLRRFGQPAVLGEIIGGIALGPTLLGALPGDPSRALFPPVVRGPLSAVGNVGLVLFMFVAGLELELGAVRRHDRTVLAVSLGAIALPFGFGLGVAALLFPSHRIVAGHSVGWVPFELFVATALSITAFPVLVRIVGDRGLRTTSLGQLAIASAALQDVAGWLLLAASLATIGSNAAHLLRIAAEAAVFALILRCMLRPGLQWMCSRTAEEHPGIQPVSLVVVLLMGCAGATQLIGLHSVIGAFALGVAFPRREGKAMILRLRQTLAPATMTVLMPVYFLIPGLQVNLRSLDAQSLWALAAILACACVGKMVGSSVPARLTGLSWRDAGALGVLLNARGLIELVVLSVGLSKGILDQRLFSVMVVVAVVTTLLAGPLLAWVLSGEERSAGMSALAGLDRRPVEQAETAMR